MCIGEIDTRFEVKPEVRKFMSKTTFLRYAILGHIAAAYQQSRFIFSFYSGYKYGDIIGVMLSVGVDGKGVVVA